MKIWVLTVKEFRMLFSTLIGWFVLAAFLLLFGGMWSMHVSAYMTWSEELTGAQSGEILRLSDQLITPTYSNMVLIFIFICPAISMRLFSEEFRQNTMELLLTSPVSTLEIVLGKFLGAMGFVSVLLAGTLYAPVVLYWWYPHDLSPYVGSYLGLWLLCAALIAMGMWFSASTRHQIVALIPSFVCSMGLYLLAFMGDESEFLLQLSFASHTAEFFRGILQWSDVSYFVGFVFVFLLATYQRVEGFRWRG